MRKTKHVFFRKIKARNKKISLYPRIDDALFDDLHARSRVASKSSAIFRDGRGFLIFSSFLLRWVFQDPWIFNMYIYFLSLMFSQKWILKTWRNLRSQWTINSLRKEELTHSGPHRLQQIFAGFWRALRASTTCLRNYVAGLGRDFSASSSVRLIGHSPDPNNSDAFSFFVRRASPFFFLFPCLEGNKQELQRKTIGSTSTIIEQFLVIIIKFWVC